MRAAGCGPSAVLRWDRWSLPSSQNRARPSFSRALEQTDSGLLVPAQQRSRRQATGSPPPRRRVDRSACSPVPTRGAAVVAADQVRPDGAPATAPNGPGWMPAPVVRSILPGRDQTTLPARRSAGPTNSRAPARDWKPPTRRPRAANRGPGPQAVRSPNSPPIPRLDAHHRHHHAPLWYRWPPSTAPSHPSCRSPVEFPSGNGRPNNHIRWEYGQRWEPDSSSSGVMAQMRKVTLELKKCQSDYRPVNPVRMLAFAFARRGARASPRDGEIPATRWFRRIRTNWRGPPQCRAFSSDAAPDQSGSPPMDCRD